MVDLAVRPSPIGWFTPKRSPNLIVENKNRRLTPVLVDTGFMIVNGNQFLLNMFFRTRAVTLANSLSNILVRHGNNLEEDVKRLGREAIGAYT